MSILSEGREFTFEAGPKRTWQGAMKGKGEIKGDIFSTGLKWEASE